MQKVQFVIEAEDQASKDVDKIRKSIDSIGDQGRKTANEINASSESMSSDIGKTSKHFGGASQAIVSSLKTAGLAVGAFAISMATMGITSGKDVEKTRAAFENLYGDTKKAGDMMMKITEFANKTPFEFPEIADMALKLKNIAGTADEDLIPALTNLGDIAASQGKPIAQAVEAYNDAITGEFERLKEFGIKAAAIKGTNKVAMTFRGETIEVEKTAEALGEYMRKIGQIPGIAGAMDKQSQTLDGRLSTLKDTFMGLTREIVGVSLTGEVIKGGLFDKISTGTQELINMITTHKDTILGIFGIIGDVVKGIAEGAMIVFMGLKSALETFATWISTNFGTQIQAIGTTIMELFQSIKGLFTGLMENKPLMDAFRIAFGLLWEGIKLVTESTIGVIIEIVKTGLTLVKDVIDIATALIKADWSGAWDGMKTLFSDFLTGVLDIFSAWFSPYFELWSQLWGSVTTWWDGFMDGLATKWSSIWGAISLAASEIWGAIKLNATTIFTGISTFLGNLWTSISTKATEGWTGLKNSVISIWQSLTSWFSGDGSTTFTATFTSMLGTVTGAAKAIFNSTIGVIESFINRAIDGINSLIRAANKVSPVQIGMVSTVSIPRFAHGGLVEGPNGLDKVPAMLTAGEVVLNAAQQNNVARAIEGGTQKGGITLILENNNFYGDDDSFAQKIGDTVIDIFKNHYALQS